MHWLRKNIKYLKLILTSIWVRILRFLMPNECYIQQLPDRMLDHKIDDFKNNYRRNYRAFHWTLSDPNRVMMFHLLLENIKGLKGNYAELGTHQGSTARIIFNEKETDAQFFVFDTFSGFDQRDVKTESELGVDTKAGHFSDTSLERVAKEITGSHNGHETLHFKKGYFPETFDIDENVKFKFVHLDADLYNPILAGLEVFYPRLVKGGYILIHDYAGEYEGTRKAVKEFLKKNKDIILVPMYDKVGSALIIKH